MRQLLGLDKIGSNAWVYDIGGPYLYIDPHGNIQQSDRPGDIWASPDISFRARRIPSVAEETLARGLPPSSLNYPVDAAVERLLACAAMMSEPVKYDNLDAHFQLRNLFGWTKIVRIAGESIAVPEPDSLGLYIQGENNLCGLFVLYNNVVRVAK